VTASGLVTFTVGCAAVVEDIARRRVSNWTSGAALASGLALHYAEQGWRGAAAAMATAHAASLSLSPGSKNARGLTRTDAIPYAPAIVLGVWLAELARG
jgi:Flp pilus assembly protein protease CpaA